MPDHPLCACAGCQAHRRDYIATQLAGHVLGVLGAALLKGPTPVAMDGERFRGDVAKGAVQMADALIAELAR